MCSLLGTALGAAFGLLTAEQALAGGAVTGYVAKAITRRSVPNQGEI